MKYTIALLLSTTCLFMACNNDPASSTTGKQTYAGNPVNNETVCYIGNSGRDTVDLSLKISGNNVTGDLNYLFFEKDQNHGSISGVLKGDTLIADYTFNAEGQQSVRQVAFLKNGTTLAEGYGDMEEKDGKMIFKDISALDFSRSYPLQKIDCTK